MPKFNKNIKAWLINESGEKIIRYAFSHEKTQEKAIEGLFKRIILKHRFDYPIAHVYVNNELLYKYIQAIPISNSNIQWYGSDISEFKLKLINTDGTKSHPFYSNSLVSKQKQFEMLIEQHCKNDFVMAIIMDKNDKIIATVNNHNGELEIYNLKVF